ncbi:MAG: MmgE/PrpD family protein, partial [Acidimicrobiia bacterium]|nr:MmgE/PrpD family protein [Acidimicrobiia bacterium]
MTDNQTIVSLLARWAASVRELESGVAEDVCRRVLDSTGIMLAAAATSAEGAAIRGLGEQLGAGGATAIGSRTTLPASSAALVNGTLAHSLDFDDTHLPSVLHPSASVVPAVMAVAQDQSIHDDTRLLCAIAVGIEIANRIGMGSYDSQLGNSVMFEHGFHATSICGAIGSAVGVAHVLDMPEDVIAHSMSIAASMGSGILEANRTGGSVKKTHCGWAAHAGVFAAQFARAGITGAPTAFEGRFGFYEAFSHGFMDESAS